VQIVVIDYGIGIPVERRGQIFERFYQAHADGYRSGMGLGLYISRQIVDLHGGALSAEFPDDGGCRFTLRLPLGLDYRQNQDLAIEAAVVQPRPDDDACTYIQS
jgi:signal transduction histidine kinase